MNIDILSGKDQSNIIQSKHFNAPMHFEVEEPLKRLQKRAIEKGFDLQVYSGFRPFEEQASMWNNKAFGKRDILDENESPIPFETLSGIDLLEAIMRWSAIPGASRHQWGTDLDIYDANHLPQNYKIQLIAEETDPDGMFGPLHIWLDELFAQDNAEGFFRPYDRYQGGVAVEKWHISYAPIAKKYLKEYSLEKFKEILATSNFELRNFLLENPEKYFQQYVTNITQ